MKKNIKCPVCGKYVFEEENDFDICDVCGWENDGVQLHDHNYAGGANDLSVNEARIEYYIGNTQKADEAARIRENYKNKRAGIAVRYKYTDNFNKKKAEYDAAREKYIDLLNELLNG